MDAGAAGTPTAAPPLPERPLLAPWASVAHDGDRLAVRNGDAAVVLEGPAAAQLLPALLPLLDGERTAAELEDGFGAAVAPAVRNALGVLAAHRLIVEGPSLATAPPAAADLAIRAAEAGLGGGSPASAVAALARRRVGVVGDGPCAALVAALVGAGGAAAARVSVADAAAGDGLDFVVGAPGAAGRTELPALDEALRAAGRPWLAVPGVDGARALVGPIVVPGASCCYSCFVARREAALAFGDVAAALAGAPVAPLRGAASALVAAVAAQVTLCALVDGVGVAVPAGVVWSIDLVPEVAVTRHVVHRVPRCPDCSPASALPALLPWGVEGTA